MDHNVAAFSCIEISVQWKIHSIFQFTVYVVLNLTQWLCLSQVVTVELSALDIDNFLYEQFWIMMLNITCL